MINRLIVNADDFALTSGISRAIVEAHQKGIVTSTTILGNCDEKLLEEKGYKTETMLILLDLEDGVEVKKYLGEKNPGDRIIDIKN